MKNNKNVFGVILRTGAVTAVMAVCVPAMSMAESVDTNYPAYMSVGAKTGSDRTIGETQLFIPLQQDSDNLIFTDLRFKNDSTQAWEGNAGIGYRAMISDDMIVGGYGFFDYKETSANNNLSQATLGAEMLTKDHDLRLNVYIPERGKKSTSDTSRLIQTGTQLFFENQQSFERGSPGADIEVGQKLPIPDTDIRVYGGAYHFLIDDDDNMNGVRGRIRWQTDPIYIGDKSFNFRFSAEAQHDNIRGGTEFAGAELVIPLGDKPTRKDAYKNPLQYRMLEPIVRDVDIVTHEAKAPATKEAASTTINGAHFAEVHVLQDNNATALNTSLTALADNAAVIFNGGSSIVIDTTLTPKAGQAIVGSNNNVVVSGSRPNQEVTVSTNSRTELVKSNSLANATPLIALASGSNTKLVDLDLKTESGNNGNDIVMVSNGGQAINSLTLENVTSDGAIIVDTSSGSSTVTVQGGEYNGLIFRTRSNAAMHVSLNDATVKRSYARAESFPQNITSMALFESMGTSAMTVDGVQNNIFIDDDAKTGGRAALGVGFVNSSTTAMQVNNFIGNNISRTQGAWDAGAILGQGTGGRLVMFDGMYDNNGDPFETVNVRIDIGKAGFTGDETGLEAANPGMDLMTYGNVQVTNTP